MAAKAMATGTDAVVEWLKNNIDSDFPYYSVWQSKNLIFSFTENDFEKAIQNLESNLEGLKESGYDDLLKIQIHNFGRDKNKLNRLYDVKTVVCSLTFRVIEMQPNGFMQPYIPQQNNREVLEALNGINERLAALEENELEELPGETGAIETTPKFDIYSLLDSFLKHPQIQQKVVGAVCGFMDKIIAPGITNSSQNMATQIQGIPNTSTPSEKVEYAINTLLQVHPAIIDDLVRLADLSKTDPGKIQALLMLLPK